MSAIDAHTPTSTLFILPDWTEISNTSYNTITEAYPEYYQHLFTINKKSFKFATPNHWNTNTTYAGHPKWNVKFFLIGNQDGLTTTLNTINNHNYHMCTELNAIIREEFQCGPSVTFSPPMQGRTPQDRTYTHKQHLSKAFRRAKTQPPHIHPTCTGHPQPQTKSQLTNQIWSTLTVAKQDTRSVQPVSIIYKTSTARVSFETAHQAIPIPTHHWKGNSMRFWTLFNLTKSILRRTALPPYTLFTTNYLVPTLTDTVTIFTCYSRLPTHLKNVLIKALKLTFTKSKHTRVSLGMS